VLESVNESKIPPTAVADPMDQPAVPAADSPFANGSGEMAGRVRELDWAKTPLGPPERWSPALKWAVGLVLASGFPKAVRWGPELVLIYNDAYRPILVDKHPGVLGKPLREAWSEIYHELGPLNEDILAGRRPAFFAQDLPWRVQRRGSEWEEARFTISYSPVPDETAPGGIGGVLTTVVETTERVRTEEALRASEAALIELNDTLEQRSARTSVTAFGRSPRTCSASRISTAIFSASTRHGRRCWAGAQTRSEKCTSPSCVIRTTRRTRRRDARGCAAVCTPCAWRTDSATRTASGAGSIGRSPSRRG